MATLFGRHSRQLFILFLVLAGCQYSYAGKEYLAGPKDYVALDQLLVGLQPGSDINQVLSGIAPQAVAALLSRDQNTFLLTLPPGISATVSHLLAAHPLVKYVEPNRVRSTTVGPPNDSSFSAQWNLTAIFAQQAWTYFPDRYLTSATASSTRVKVAILDTGVDCTHPDFMNAGGSSTDAAQGGQLLWASSMAIQPTTITPHACAWQDDNGHGTHTAGILAAATNNGAGVASLGFPLQLIVIKTSDQNGNATDYQVSEGIYAAVNQGAQVISMSLGGVGYSQTMQCAMDYAWNHNVLVVAAAGNTGSTGLIYPGDGNHVMAVAATDSSNAVASFSSYGEWVRIAAPGVNILSTLPTYGSGDGTNYGALEGTSMATPHVAALGGLLFAANPGISVEAVAQRIMQTAQSPNTGWDQHLGYGVINAGAALGNVSGPFTQGALTGQVTDTSGNAINASATVTVTGGAFYTTDATGLFRINLSPGSYNITVTASGYTTVNLQGVVVAGADTMLSIPLGGSQGAFSGVVTHNGIGVSGAVVEAFFGGVVAGTAVADSSGNYNLSVPPNTYTLTASAPNYLSTTSGSDVLSASGTVTVNLTLNALGNIAGTVTDLNGVPVPNVEIDFTSSSATGGAFTAAGGTYSTYGLPAGTYTVTASASGYTSVAVGSVSVTNNTSTLVNLQFSTGVALSNGLLGYWPLNEGSGSVAHDQSGNGKDVALTNATWTSGLLFPSAVAFSGSNSYGISPAIAFTGPVSASVWVHPASSGAWSTLLQSNGWFLGIDQNAAHYKFTVNMGVGTTGTCVVVYTQEGCAQGGAIATGWHMVTGTYDGTNAVIYLDGVKVASDTMTTVSGNWAVQFGNNWGGAMQSARVYGRALTASEVSSLFSLSANLSLTKAADASTVAAGGSIGYTLSAGNSGGGSATAVTLSDPLPTGTGVTWSISPAYTGPGTCSIAGGTLSCNFGTLAAGGSASVHIASSTSTASCGPYANTATLSAGNTSSVQASATIAVTCSQSISFGALASQAAGAVFSVTATATSGLGVSFDANTTPSICSVSGATVTTLMGGTCTVTATQAGNTYYSAAAPVSQSFTVTPASQTISFAALSNQPLGTSPFTVSATATSGLTVSFNSNTTASVCTMSGNTVTLVAIGTCSVQATQAGNSAYGAAPAISRSFMVTAGIGITGLSSLSFPNTIVGKASAAQSFTLQNNGNTALTIASIALAGPDAANYQYIADAVHPCPIAPATLAAASTCTLNVTFAPASAGAHNNAQLSITDNSGNVPGTVQPIGLTGTGIVLSSIAVTANSGSLAMGAGEQFTATGKYSDNSTADLTSQATWASSATGVATIGSSGLATAVAAGQTNITATLSAVMSNSFQLSVSAGAASSITASSGSGQSAPVGSALAGVLQALVKDSGGNALANVSVTFTAPASGASGTFSNGLAAYTTTTNSSGIAASLAFTANTTEGAYSVTAAAAGVAVPASFSLTNITAPSLSVAESTAMFVQGQSTTYAITVSNAANAGPTSGTVTITLSVPPGLTLTALNGGSAFVCSVASASCSTNSVLPAGFSGQISVTMSVAYNAQGPISVAASLSGGASQNRSASYSSPIISACAVTQDTTTSVADVQQIVNEALGVSAPTHDLSGDGSVNAVDLQIVLNAALQKGCSTP